MILEAKHVCKQLKGKVILDDINLKLEGGKVYGFVGRNGSGKTMLFRALSGLMHIDSGEICCAGRVLYKDIPILPNLGIVIENAGLYPEFTGFQNLKFLANINKKISDEQIRESIKRVGLNPDDAKVVRKYSLGMKQRIVIAQAVMENPDIIMLDEPTNALDEEGVELVRKIIKEEKSKGTLILLASHNKEDIENLSDEVFVLEHGRLWRRDLGYVKK